VVLGGRTSRMTQFRKSNVSGSPHTTAINLLKTTRIKSKQIIRMGLTSSGTPQLDHSLSQTSPSFVPCCILRDVSYIAASRYAKRIALWLHCEDQRWFPRTCGGLCDLGPIRKLNSKTGNALIYFNR